MKIEPARRDSRFGKGNEKEKTEYHVRQGGLTHHKTSLQGTFQNSQAERQKLVPEGPKSTVSV